jgi:hypothetical protein
MLETNTTRPPATRRGEGMLSHQHPTKCPGESADDFACLRVSMEERARLIGAELSIQSHPGKGTTVSVLVPLGGSES